MTMFNDATKRQHAAARPDASTWVTANAGSGKTRVLTDRVARLLLDGVLPQNILCLTYTKAAASEMQNRLFQRLGQWAMLEKEPLEAALKNLGENRDMTPETLRQARTLFARAIETPGGLKIQTIHAFCASLLRRFPLEAGVVPNFVEMDDRAAQLMRTEIVEEMASGHEIDLVSGVADAISDQDFSAITAQILGDADALTQECDRAQLFSVLGAAAPFELRDVLDDTFAVGAIDLVRDLIPFLQAGGTNDQKAGRRLNSVTGQTVHDLEILEDVFLTGEKAKIPFSAKIGAFPTKATREAMGQAMEDALNDLMSRVETARKRRVILEVVAKTERIRAFARAFVPRYEAAKHARGLLDFDDLIRKARALLSDAEMAAWVLYKLDGQIDHILVDEAQDTSPAQWHVIRKLAEDFLAGGQAQSGTDRTLFVVGDKKQSIYSFQGADPAAFDAMKSGFSESLAAIGTSLHDRSLDHSFRSSPSILRLVDTVFDENGAHALGENSAHIPFHARLPGRVDMWPLVPPAETTKPAEWDDPVDLPSPEHHQAALATMIAKEIRRMLDDGTQIPEIGPDGSLTARRVEPRDFLILVQRRSGIFPHIIRACKTAELPIAGSDKLKVGAELAVRDLGAFLSFLATADDDLSLASCLRSPLFGWSEQEIYTLAHHRPEGGRLWEHLRKQADAFPDTCTVINDMRGQTDFLRPYDLLQRLLIRHGRRDRLIARLGAEAEDGINALLAQALTYESQAIPSLTGFLAWMQTDDLEIKRQIDSMSNQIRVMSVHGAKGLEAPIVILPDTIRDSKGNRDAVVVVDDEAFHKPSKPMQPQPMAEVITSLEAKDAQEGDRLLYVAMTRAEKWLIVAGAGKASKSKEDWHTIVENAMPHAGAVALDTPNGAGLRVENDIWPDPDPKPRDTTVTPLADLPAFVQTPAAAPMKGSPYLSPSDLPGAKALPGEGLEEAQAKAYGTFVHALMEHATPGHPLPQLAAPTELDHALAERAVEEATRVINTAGFADIFASGALREVDIVAQVAGKTMRGTIDCLIVNDSSVRIIDFKSNRAVPQRSDAVPEGIVNQMAAYATAISQIYPDHAITCEILWTATPHLMSLSHDIVRQAQQKLAYLDDLPNAP